MSTATLTKALLAEFDIPGFECRFCSTPLKYSFVDLGMAPRCQNVVLPEDYNKPEVYYPLHAFVCHECFLVQIDSYVDPSEIFSEYAYFSSYSDSWLEHVERYANAMTDRFGLIERSQIIELASNDGYALQYFAKKGMPVLGIEPAANVAEVAQKKGIPTRVEFFGNALAKKLVSDGTSADLLFGNNVLAHVPDLNDFVRGAKTVLAPSGVLTFEFPHLMRLMEGNQFDTIYHEHFCYFSFSTVERVFAAHGIVLFDVEELPTHGGSIRIYGRHAENETWPTTDRAKELIGRERAQGFASLDKYAGFGEQVRETKRRLLQFLSERKREGNRIVGYGAAGKGNTLLNYCGIGTDFIDYTVDRNPYKQDTFLPGSRIPVYDPSRIFETKPDYVLILPWNLKDEIASQMQGVREWGGRFVVPIPTVEVLE